MPSGDDVADSQADIMLFADGACSGNPGPGGWAFILREATSGRETRKSGAERLTTNNRMELLSVIYALESLSSRRRVALTTDSQYVAKGISEWMAGWKSNGWRRKNGHKWEPVKNLDLWQRLDDLLSKHNVTCQWVRGHAGHRENEDCDQMAVAAYLSIDGDAPPDDDLADPQ